MKKILTPQEMQKKSVRVQIAKYGSKEAYKAEMKRRALMRVYKKKNE